MKLSSAVAVVLAAIALSVGAAFGAAQVTRTDSAKAGGSSQVVSQLKKVNAKLDDIYVAIGESQYRTGTVRGLLKGVCKELGSIACSP